MARAVPQLETKSIAGPSDRTAVVAWLLISVYHAFQHALRTAPNAMTAELGRTFNLSTFGIAAIAGLFYYGYSPFSLIAGSAMDRIGTRRLLPAAAAAAGFGALLFATGNPALAGAGRFIQGAGGVFGLVGAIYIVAKTFSPLRTATMIGITQMIGLAGSLAGQFVVGRWIGAGLPIEIFWASTGVAGLGIAVFLFVLLPNDAPQIRKGGWFDSASAAFNIIFRNPQSILCGLIAGLIFMPTTIFDVTWGVQYVQGSHDLEFGAAVIRSAAVPMGWIIGCPLLGLWSDRIGKRKPIILRATAVLFICLAWTLFVRAVVPPYVIGLLVGIASGSAMLLYAVILELHPSQLDGAAVGSVNFLNCTLSALIATSIAWILQILPGDAAQSELQNYQTTLVPLLCGVGIAFLLTLQLKETGRASHSAPPKTDPHI
jgi:MFS family permease